ncbi:hypothetical protein CSIM01_01007 [Colletotrichum simmondsii]|uniref:CorA-like Mg2+ transporter n=1 Tax=Colletotrichum simmondsii TaxID=703756 RepID=A0A135S071_9PEZI|nr:hypothetical protein CSIM01_01007 [Colletotrichum simmondsii]
MASEHLNALPGRITEAAEKGMTRESFFSFGDEGLTASVGATGQLLRITQHFPGQKTGVCVDDNGMAEPYYVSWRLKQFFERSLNENYGGIGPRFDALCSGRKSKHDIINDRWPTFTRTMTGDTSNKLHVSYVAFRGTIYQKFEIIDKQENLSEVKAAKDDEWDALTLDPDVLLIRDLDFVNEYNYFNKVPSYFRYDRAMGVYKTEGGDAGRHILREHISHNKHFVLHLQVLDEDGEVEFFKKDQGTFYGIRKNGKSSGQPVLKIVLAYTLRQGSEASEPKSRLPDWEMFGEADELLRRWKTVSLTANPTLDLFFKRQLEYILSVCSIPVSEGDPDGVPAYALTCGDVDGHRVATAASFYAFQFLQLGFDHFKTLHSESKKPLGCTCNQDERPLLPYVCMMKRRIEDVCKGHMKWVFQKAVNSESLFGPNQWTNGDEIEGWESNEWLPRKSLIDTPFHFIKAADFYKRIGVGMPENLAKKARAVYKQWISHLGEVEKSGKYAFPSYKAGDDEIPTKTFYLTDHALIWQAARSAESLNLQFAPEGDLQIAERFSALRLRENIVKRFTTENPLLRQRMIAVKRSSTQTRFLFRSKDVALFRAMEEGLFEQAEIQWTNTLDSQKHHEGNDDTDWSDPRRFALAITMARHGKLINFRTRKELTEKALSILLSTSCSNGLFTGALDERQNPAVYEDERDRDNYWTVVFEVPYILLKDYCVQPRKNSDLGTKGGSITVDSRLELMHHSIKGISKYLGGLSGHPIDTTGPRYRYGYWMKHNLPFNNVIDDNNIVELQDEWLYNEPDFFVNATAMTNVDTNNMPDADANLETSMSAKVISPHLRLKIDIQDRRPLKDKRPLSSFLVEHYPNDEEDRFEEAVKSQRDARNAKKRFWAFISTNAEGNSSCTKTLAPNENREQREMEQFFDRHMTSSNFFDEETIASLNIWTTEFQMAFYSGVEKERFWHGNKLEKIGMGFRFEGDFFDKYWTCRFVVANPHLPASKYEVKSDLIKLLEQDQEGDTSFTLEIRTGPWEQRRVLELILFGYIISKMATSAGYILELAESTVLKQKTKLEQRLRRLQGSQMFKQEQGDPTPHDGGRIDYNSFVITSNEFRKFQERLQMIHGDFAKTRPISDHWLNREKDRQAEQPRWTFSDESRYRSVLNKLLVTNRRAIQDLDRNLTGISILAESITQELEYVSGGLESISNEESRRNNKDVKLFTYTTAIFLPLGFATGMFSMSGTPDAQTVGRMFGLFIGVFILGTLTILIVGNVDKLIKRGRQKIHSAYLWGMLPFLVLIMAKFYVKEVRRERRKSKGNGEGSAGGKSVEETNAECEDVADKTSRRRFCGLKLYRKEKNDALAKRKEEHVEEGRGVLGVPRVDETATSGSVQSFKG